MRPKFDGSYVQSELERIGEHLDQPLTVFLIGGGAMAIHRLKDTTTHCAAACVRPRAPGVLSETGEQRSPRQSEPARR